LGYVLQRRLRAILGNEDGGVYLKKSEPILLTGSAGGIPPEPPFRPPRQKAEAERQTAKEPGKMSARTLFWPEAGFSLFYFPCLILIYLLSLY
jgi:hypothetical protein